MPSEDYRPDVHGLVEATWHTEEPSQDVINRALGMECPDCCVNVFIEEGEVGVYALKVAHDETCPVMAELGRGEG